MKGATQARRPLALSENPRGTPRVLSLTPDGRLYSRVHAQLTPAPAPTQGGAAQSRPPLQVGLEEERRGSGRVRGRRPPFTKLLGDQIVPAEVLGRRRLPSDGAERSAAGIATGAVVGRRGERGLDRLGMRSGQGRSCTASAQAWCSTRDWAPARRSFGADSRPHQGLDRALGQVGPRPGPATAGPRHYKVIN
jgi:hypothetical protein